MSRRGPARLVAGAGAFVLETTKMPSRLIENMNVKLVSVLSGGAVFVGILIGGARWMNSVDITLRQINTKLQAIESDSYTLARAAEQALRMAIENPGMRIPDPREPSRIIVVSTRANSALPKGLP